MIRRRLALAASALALAFGLTACGWHGVGTVEGKSYRPPYVSIVSTGKTTVPITYPACNQLVLRDDAGESHALCLDRETWDRARIGDRLEVSE